MTFTTSGASGFVVGAKRATTSPSRLITNFSKFQVMSPGPVSFFHRKRHAERTATGQRGNVIDRFHNLVRMGILPLATCSTRRRRFARVAAFEPTHPSAAASRGEGVPVAHQSTACRPYSMGKDTVDPSLYRNRYSPMTRSDTSSFSENWVPWNAYNALNRCPTVILSTDFGQSLPSFWTS
jgi:hypothetical protein